MKGSSLKGASGGSLTFSWIFSGIALGVGSIWLIACVGNPPLEDFTLARSAYDSAREAEAIRYVPGLWYKADETYKHAQLLYKDREYQTSKSEFIEARSLLEKSENAARAARLQSGGVPP